MTSPGTDDSTATLERLAESEAITSVSEALHTARTGDYVLFTAVIGDLRRRFMLDVYEVLELDGTRELRGHLLRQKRRTDSTTYFRTQPEDELVLRVRQMQEPNDIQAPDYQYEVAPLPYYEKQTVHLELGPDGNRIGLYVDDVDQVTVFEPSGGESDAE